MVVDSVVAVVAGVATVVASVSLGSASPPGRQAAATIARIAMTTSQRRDPNVRLNRNPPFVHATVK